VTRHLAALIALASLTGCDIETGWPGGTGVGNPGSTNLQTRKSDDVKLEQGASLLASLEVTRCPPADAEAAPVDRTVDLLDDGPFSLPGGEWCAVVARFDAPLAYAGRRDEDEDEDEDEDGPGTFELLLDVPEVTMAADGPFVDGGSFMLELGFEDWLAPDRIGGLEDGTHVVVDVSHPAHDSLAGSIASGSAILWDADDDGHISGDERKAPFAAGPDWSHEGEHH
jgi:hypothetical protein